MKKARQVEIPEDRTLDADEYNELKTHAINSTLWYLSNYPAHSSKLRTRLLDKGYVSEPLLVEGEERDLLEEVISELRDSHFINDHDFLVSKLNGELSKGKGVTQALMKLRMLGVADDELEAAKEEVLQSQERLDEALAKGYAKALRSAAVRKHEGWNRRVAIKSKLASWGFDFDAIDEWMELHHTDED